MTKTKHILGLSGGKDSAALAVHMNNRHPDIDVEYFFTDTGYELQETYDFLDKLKTRLDKPIHYIHPTNSFDYYMKKYNNFLPSQMARWCTIEMKLKSMEKWLKPSIDAGEEIITYVGIRYDERGRVGYYLTKFLLKKKYQVHGIKRRTSLINTQRIDEFFNDKNLHDKNFKLYHVDR